MAVVHQIHPESVLIVNKSLSWQAKGDAVVVVRVDGTNKLLGCSGAYLDKVLSAIDGTRTYREVVEILAGNGAADDTESSLQALLGQHIISCKPSSKEADAVPAADWVAVVGDGPLAEMVCRKLTDNLGNSACRHLPLTGVVSKNGVAGACDAVQVQLDDNCAFLVVCPEQATYELLLALNDLALATAIPMVFFYFNGMALSVGPAVIPWKSACLGCLLEPEFAQLGRASGIILTREDLLPLVEAWPVGGSDADSDAMLWAAGYVCTDVTAFVRFGTIPRLLKKQLSVPSAVLGQPVSRDFDAVSTCTSCSGMNRAGVVSFAEAQPGRSAEVALVEKPVVYQQGGLRSVSSEDALGLVRGAIQRNGLEVRIEHTRVTVLDTVLFKYTAECSGRYDRRLPFLLPSSWGSRGKGLTAEQAYLSAGFELFERLSASFCGDLEVVRATWKEAAGVALDLGSFIGKLHLDGLVDRFTEDTPIDWVWGHSLVHGRPVLVPASMVFGSGRFLGHFFGPSMGGLAAGAALEDAVLQALLEVVEHDAWMIWQANAVATDAIGLDTIRADSVKNSLAAIQRCGFRVVLRDYTTDFEIPVVKAWLINDRNYAHHAFSGFGAHLDPDIAVGRAITEANQFITQPDRTGSPHLPPTGWSLVDNTRSLYGLYSFARSEIKEPDKTVAYGKLKNQSTGSVTGDISTLIRQMQHVLPELDVVVVNLTRPEFGIPVVRAVVGGGVQRFEKPVLSPCRRLFEVPVKLGCLEKETPYNELFLGQFPH